MQAIAGQVRRLEEGKADLRALGAVFLEAQRSLGQDWMKMLASAYVGLHRPDIEADMKNRVFRIALSLEPSDVVTLREYYELALLSHDNLLWNREETMIEARPLSFEVLEAAVCLMRINGAVMGRDESSSFVEGAVGAPAPYPVVTRIGEAVVKLLSTFQGG